MKNVSVDLTITRRVEVEVEVEDDFEPGDHQDQLLELAKDKLGSVDETEVSETVELEEWTTW